jgi:hypothetical protein
MRKTRRLSLPYARRRLASIDAQLAYWHAVKPVRWQDRADKARALERLEAERPRFDRVVHPRVEPEWRLPF